MRYTSKRGGLGVVGVCFFFKEIKEGFKKGCGYHVFYIFFIYVEGRFHRGGGKIVLLLVSRSGMVRDDYFRHISGMRLSDPTRFGTNKRNPYSSMGLVYFPTFPNHKNQQNLGKYTNPMDGMGK